MKSLPSIDMAAVTRLTREGRLDDAMRLLQGGSVADVAPDAACHRANVTDDAAQIIDMQPPSAENGGAWTAPTASTPSDAPPAAAQPSASAQPSAPPPSSLRATLERVLKPRIRVGNAAERSADPLPPGARFEQRSFGTALANRSYKLYVPSSYDGAPRALLVMLHGCTQSPDDFARGTRMNALAEEHGFLVVYPAQSPTANSSKCWNWFNAADQQRDHGEPALIAGITREVMHEFAIDPRRVYVAGLSAGGAMAAILGAAYPELYAAVGVHSGLAPGAARDVPSAFAAMRSGGSAPATASARNVPTIVFHGDADTTVVPLNGDQVAAHARGTAPLRRQSNSGSSAGGVTYTRNVESTDDGRVRLEQWLVHGGGHAWSGGDASGTFTAPLGPDASREMLRFFKEQAHANSTG
ncbi:MAG: PHB depolymerase family esterase [Dokdonella sp.]